MNDGWQIARVAGITVPAFVERASRQRLPALPRGVAGITVPAFVERWTLAVRQAPLRMCRRDYGPGLR